MRRIALLLLAAAPLLAACGRVGDPIAPGRALLAPPEEVRLSTRGLSLLVSWAPARRTVAGTMGSPAGYVVEREVRPPDEDGACPDCPLESGVVGRVDTESREAEGKPPTAWTDGAVRPGYRYRYRVRAVDDRGRVGEPSPPVETRFLPLAAPQAIARAADRAALIRFLPPTLPEGWSSQGLRVYGASGSFLAAFPLPDAGEAGQGAVEGLENDVAVTLELRWQALDATGSLVESEAAHLTLVPQDREPPPPPGQLVAFPETASITLLWMPARGESYREVILERSEEGGPFLERARVPGSETLYRDEAVRQGTAYRYRCIALDPAGNRSDPAETGELRLREERRRRP